MVGDGALVVREESATSTAAVRQVKIKTEKDHTPISKQQRYIFDREVKAGNVPPKIMQEYDKIKTARAPGYPKELAAIVNACIDKEDAQNYALQVNWKDGMALSNFEQIWHNQTVSKVQKGLTWSELCMKWGAGDMEKGEKNVNIALSKKHIVKKNGFYFTRRIVADETVGKSWTSQVGQECADKIKNWEDVKEQMQLTEWAEYGFDDSQDRSEAMVVVVVVLLAGGWWRWRWLWWRLWSEAGMLALEDDSSTLATEKTKSHARTAIEQADAVMGEIKKLGMTTCLGAASDGAKALFQKARATVAGFEPTMAELMDAVVDADALDADIKSLLKQAAKGYAELIDYKLELSSIANQMKRKEKSKGKPSGSKGLFGIEDDE